MPMLDGKKFLRYMQGGQESILDCFFLALDYDVTMKVCDREGNYETQDYGSLYDDLSDENPEIIDVFFSEKERTVTVIADM
jgi:hypothetical protein